MSLHISEMFPIVFVCLILGHDLRDKHIICDCLGEHISRKKVNAMVQGFTLHRLVDNFNTVFNIKARNQFNSIHVLAKGLFSWAKAGLLTLWSWAKTRLLTFWSGPKLGC